MAQTIAVFLAHKDAGEPFDIALTIAALTWEWKSN